MAVVFQPCSIMIYKETTLIIKIEIQSFVSLTQALKLICIKCDQFDPAHLEDSRAYLSNTECQVIFNYTDLRGYENERAQRVQLVTQWILGCHMFAIHSRQCSTLFSHFLDGVFL